MTKLATTLRWVDPRLDDDWPANGKTVRLGTIASRDQITRQLRIGQIVLRPLPQRFTR